MPRMKSCLVCGRIKGSSMSLHQFPEDIDTRDVWRRFVNGVGCGGGIRGGGGPTKFAETEAGQYICSLHFDEDSFKNRMGFLMGFDSKLLLKKGAFPTLNGKENIHNSRPSSPPAKRHKTFIHDGTRKMDETMDSDIAVKVEDVKKEIPEHLMCLSVPKEEILDTFTCSSIKSENSAYGISTSMPPEPVSGPLQCYPLRLHPGQEISSTLANFVRQHGLTSAFVMTCVGSVTQAYLRMADSVTTKRFEGPFEIVSLVGTLNGGRSGHLHISLSDKDGSVIGGHVMGDLTVHTTAELVIGACAGLEFVREYDAGTGYDELVVKKDVKVDCE